MVHQDSTGKVLTLREEYDTRKVGLLITDNKRCVTFAILQVKLLLKGTALSTISIGITFAVSQPVRIVGLDGRASYALGQSNKLFNSTVLLSAV